MTAVICYCVFNLFWAQACQAYMYAFCGMLLVTFFYSTFTNFSTNVTFSLF